ncbi:MAG: phosphoenolpyruvate carboxylase [Bdellovibrionota bacterium]
MRKNLPPELKLLVNKTLALLGEEIAHEFGAASYREIEKIRREMAGLRNFSPAKAIPVLARRRATLKKTAFEERHRIAQSFTLMMELMNACENAYRSHRLIDQNFENTVEGAEEIILVVTAHPTESRYTATIPVFKKLQRLLRVALETDFPSVREELRIYVRLLLILPLAPSVAPTPEDEAEHLYRWVLDPEILDTVLDRDSLLRRVRFRAWSGGDKDGHPGIDEKVMLHSLSLSRRKILNYLRVALADAEVLLRGAAFFDGDKWKTFYIRLESLEVVSEGDALRCSRVQDDVLAEAQRLLKELRFDIVPLKRIVSLSELFPKWVVPLELRESSDIVESIAKSASPAASGEAIVRMLKALAEVSSPECIRAYVQSWILSQVRNTHDLSHAEKIQVALWGECRLPIVSLFENRAALETAPEIIEGFLDSSPQYVEKLRTQWKSRYEMMLGYSDSAKESGVLASRVLVATAMRKLEAALIKRKIVPIFFHGSGGSIERGGGTVEEQMAVWTPGARRIYKVTVQGEMVARSFASSEHFQRYVQNIDRSSRSLVRKTSVAGIDTVLTKLAMKNAGNYAATVDSPEFLSRVERATIYPFLHTLKIGSRPSKRSGLSKVTDLRAIPWVLCWTQNRVLFPTWWGLAEAWDSLTATEKQKLQKIATTDPLWSTYLKQLGFTLAKVDFAPWFTQLERLGKTDAGLLEWKVDFERRFGETRKLLGRLVKSKELLWFRPWLQESIHLRRTMIYPLNLLQDLAEEESDESLLRLTVTGIASGMLTSG